MRNRFERVSYINFITKIAQLDKGFSFVIFTSTHEIRVGPYDTKARSAEVKVESISGYYLNDPNNSRLLLFIGKKHLVEYIKRALNIIITDKNKLDALSPELKNDIKSVIELSLTRIACLEPPGAIKALEALGGMKEICDILNHPCPQNKIENYPYFGAPTNAEIVIYKNFKSRPAYERRGMLNLSSRRGVTATYVTKSEVNKYIFSLISERQQKQINQFTRIDILNDDQKNILDDLENKFYKLV